MVCGACWPLTSGVCLRARLAVLLVLAACHDVPVDKPEDVSGAAVAMAAGAEIRTDTAVSSFQPRYDATGEDDAFSIDPPRLAQGLVLELGLAKIELLDGLVVPLTFERPASDGWPALRRLGGLAWEGQGRLEVQLPSPADRQALVVDLSGMGVPLVDLEGLRVGEPLTVPLDRLLLLSADASVVEQPVESLPPAPPELQLEPGETPAMLSRIALAAYGPDGARWLPALFRRIREDAFLQDLTGQVGSSARGFGAVHVALPTEPVPTDGWLHLVRDPARNASPWADAVFWIWSPGPGEQKPLAVGPVVDRSEALARRVEADVVVTSAPDGGKLPVRVVGVIELEGVAEPLRAFRLEAPTAGVVPGSLHIEAIELETGVPIAIAGARDVSLAQQPAEILCVLPAPVPAGEPVQVRYRLTAELPFDAVVQDGAERLELGPATRTWDPTLRLHAASELGAVAHRVAVGVPPETGLVALLTGIAPRRWEDQGLRWSEVSSEQPRRMLGVAFGRWASWTSSPAEPGLELAVHRFPEAGPPEDLAPLLYRLVASEEALLGAYPWPSLTFYDGPFAQDEVYWNAGYGLIGGAHILASAAWVRSLEARMPGWPDSFVAHELAHAWWGHELRPASVEDRWLEESLANVTACLALDRAFPGQGRCDHMRSSWRRMAEQPSNPRALSLTRAVGARDWMERVYVYGPLLLLDVVRARVGAEPFERGLALAVERHRGDTISTAQLMAALEDSSGQELDALFRYWIEVGRLPVLTGEYWAVDAGGGRVTIEGRVHSDVVAGTLEVPVRVTSGTEVLDHWIPVRDGAGRFTLGPVAAGEVEVLLDPDQHIIARGRSMVLRQVVREPDPR
jgi:hypothetical protein